MNNEKNSNNWWDIEKKPQNLDIPVVNNGVSQTPVKEQNTQNTTNEVIPEIKGMENTITKNNTTEEDLMRAFIGKNLESLAQSFNFAMFFFGPYYLLYRKMIGYGIVFFIITLPLNIIVANSQSYYYFFVLLLVNGIAAAAVNKLYYNFALRKVKKLQAKDFKYSIGNIEDICKRKGGTNILYPIIGFIVYIVLLLAIIYLLLHLGYITITLGIL